MHTFHPSILREYDIRGRVGDTLNPIDTYEIGRRIGTQLPLKAKVAVARDGRVSSPSLLKSLAEGLSEQGCQVIDVGLGPTPMLYFSVKHLQADAGIMVTGSHNPPDENGLKITLKNRPFYGDDIRALRTIQPTSDRPQGTILPKSILPDYVARLLQDYRPGTRALRVIWDSGSGATGEVVEALLPHLVGYHRLLNGVIDGTFPAHHPDPSVPKNLEQLIESVKEREADVGLAFDGDGDRLGVVDGQGRILWADQLMILFARDILAQHPGRPIIADVKSSQSLFDEIKALGGVPHMSPTGHSLIKAEMPRIKAVFAGEMSGHLFFADEYYGYDDGPYAALRLLRLLQDSPHSLSELYDQLPQFFNTPELRIDCSDDQKFQVIAQIQERFKDSPDVITIDGVRVKTPEGWWLLRASNTGPALIGRCEANTAEGLKKLQHQMTEVLQSVGLAYPNME